jgi:hypothetical protein
MDVSDRGSLLRRLETGVRDLCRRNRDGAVTGMRASAAGDGTCQDDFAAHNDALERRFTVSMI